MRDYVELLYYEKVRYEDLLKTVNRVDNPMTDEEWESSWEYFSKLLEEANIKFEYVKEIVQEAFLTKEEKEKGYQWIFDFIRQKLYIWDASKESFEWHRDESKSEQYSEFLSRIYGIPVEKLNGKNDLSYMAKETTFQVTEDCNMACTYCVAGDTKIMMANCTAKNIKDIQVGDQILGFEEKTENHRQPEIIEAKVLNVFHRKAKVFKVILETGETVFITPNHKVLVGKNGCTENENVFIEIGKLSQGRTLYRNPLFCETNKYVQTKSSDDYKKGYLSESRIASMEEIPEEIDVYNIETESGTYIANGIAVHNCYQHNKKPNAMSFDIAKTYIDMLLDNDPKISSYYDSEKMVGATFDFIGGEPWLQVDLITKISNYIVTELFRRKHKWAIRFMFSVCSNGLMHYDPRVQEYLKKHRTHLCYNVSIDGHKKLHDTCRIDKCGKGTYDRAYSAAMQWKNEIKGYPTNKMTVSPFNVPYLFDALIHMIDSGYKHINVNCVMEEGWTKAHAAELYWQLHKLVDYLKDNELLEQINFSIFDENKGKPASENDNSESNPCGGTGNMLAIDWKGDIYPCLRYMENSISSEKREPFIIGNVFDGVNILPEHRQRVDLLRGITRRTQTTDKCYYCPISSLCPNCNGYAYEANGTPDMRTTFICDIAKAEALANYYYYSVIGKPVVMHCPKEWAVEIIGEEEYNKLIENGRQKQ